jgi:hypothetical protein
MHGPKDTMYPNQGKGCEPEAYGAYGEKESMPGRMTSLASDDGNHDLSGQNADAAYHKNPAVSAYPDNLQGEATPPAAGDSGNPSAAEGGTGPSGY